MSFVLALKLALVPAIIGCVSLAGKKWGPGIAGWLSAFPVVAGPILLLIAIEQGPSFARSAASSTLLAILAALTFGLSYSWLATRYSWIISLAGSFTCYFLAVVLLNSFTPSLVVTMTIVLITLLIVPRFYPTIVLPKHPILGPHNDTTLRMATGAALVLIITHFSTHLGAHLSGLLAMFPVMASVLAVFTHKRSGNIFAIFLLRGMAFGYYSFACFCFTLSLMLSLFNITSSFLVAFSAAAITQVASRKFLRRHLSYQ